MRDEALGETAWPAEAACPRWMPPLGWPNLPISVRDLLAASLMEERKLTDVPAPDPSVQGSPSPAEHQGNARGWQPIAETQEKAGPDAPVTEAHRTLHEQSGVVYAFAGGTAQSLDHGTPGPQGAQTNE